MSVGKKLVIDLDNTILKFCFPEIGQPIKDSVEALWILNNKGWDCLISSCRNNPTQYAFIEHRDKNIRNVSLALKKFGFPNIKIDYGRGGKPIAKWYIDDQGIRFQNNWDEIINLINTKRLQKNNYYLYNREKPLMTISIGIENCVFDDSSKLINDSKEAIKYMVKSGFRIILSTIKSNRKYFNSYIQYRKELLNVITLLKDFKIPFHWFDDGSIGKVLSDFYIEPNMITFHGSWKEIIDFLC